MSLYTKLKPLIFKLDPENAHNLTINLLSLVEKLKPIESMLSRRYEHASPSLAQNLHGLHFPNPIGLASGFDKNASSIPGLACLGFGFLELGSVTYLPQAGNPKPRIFRHPKEESLQNALGFNNIGARGFLENMQKHYPYRLPLGINIGKNKNTQKKHALDDYRLSLELLKDSGDYFVFNLSSPNTPGLRDLQDEGFISELLPMARSITSKALFLKISPDMEVDSMLTLCRRAIELGLHGIIATNTTMDYGLVANPYKKDGLGFGGISGRVLCEKSREVLRLLASNFFGKVTIISVGGIHNADEAYMRLRLGASLVQVLSGLVYNGPGFISSLNKGIEERLKSHGFSSVKEIIGVDVKGD